MDEIQQWRGAKQVSFGEVRRRLEQATLVERSEVLDFIRHQSQKIRPSPDVEWVFGQMLAYLLECIARGPIALDDEEETTVHAPFEAARELVSWFDWYAHRSGASSGCVRAVVDRLESVYRDGDDHTRNCIETGFLEHALEVPANRKYFSHWQHDALLADGYSESLRWGVAHERPKPA